MDRLVKLWVDTVIEFLYFQTKDSEGKDDGMNLLFSLSNPGTYDQDEMRKGLIYPSTNREWIEKSDTGFPFIKYV